MWRRSHWSPYGLLPCFRTAEKQGRQNEHQLKFPGYSQFLFTNQQACPWSKLEGWSSIDSFSKAKQGVWQSRYSAHRAVLSEVRGTTAVSEYKKHLIITGMGNAASYREQVWLQEYSSWEVDAIWLSLSGWLWISVIDWWLIDRW